MTVKEFMTKESPALLLGGLIGAGAALLFAPSSGKEIRGKLGEIAEEVRDKAQEYINESRETIKSTAETGQKYYSKKKTLITSPIEACMDAYSREKKRLEKTTH